MRKPVFPRILLLLLAYIGVFVLLVSVQFAKRGGFTRKVGALVVSGQYRPRDESAAPMPANEYYLDGDVHVFFGGMDFGMVQESGGRSLYIEHADGTRAEALPERMVMSDDSALFVFPGGTELKFSTRYAGGALEMRIDGVFSEDATGLVLPFTPQGRTEIREAGNGRFVAVLGGVNYSFGNSPMDDERTVLLINAGGVPVSYRVIPERGNFSPNDFILARAETAEAYHGFIAEWRDENFSRWNNAAAPRNNEDMITALAGEALVRGTYKAAVASVPAAFLRGTVKTYRSSAFLGGMNQAYRSLVALDREKLARLSRQVNDKSLEFLFEPRVFEYLAVRRHLDLIDAASDLARTIDPSALSLDIVPGILEGYMDWRIFRPSADNPFARLTDEALVVISESLRRIPGSTVSANVQENSTSFGDRVFVFKDGVADTEFNLRLGKALVAYAETAQDESWVGIGRSMVLSALSLGDVSGAVRTGLSLSGSDGTGASAGAGASGANNGGAGSTAGNALTTARLYRTLSPLDAYPRAVSVGALTGNIWAWTAAQEVSAVQRTGELDISVTFPAGETHFMIIRGIRPFSRIRLYNMDFRSDPQFERYDSSGWSYIAQEQTLILKMRHRADVEHIHIIFREQPRPAENPPRVELAPGPAAGAGNAGTGTASGGTANPAAPGREETIAP